MIANKNERGQLCINGLKVDSQAIANGLYEIICDAGEEAIVAFGMIPKWVMDLFEKQLREKMIEMVCKQFECTPEEYAPYLSEEKMVATINPIMKEVCSGIYTAASRAGKMVV